MTPGTSAGDTLAGRMVLAIFAHPDDESLACGGTLAKLADAGARVVVMCASHGERGSHDGPWRNDALGIERSQELFNAAATLDVTEVRLLSHPDGDLRWADVAYFNAEIVLFLRRYDTAAVITFGEDGLYWHPDHIAVYERVVTALKSLRHEAPPLYFVTMPNGAMATVVRAAKARGWTPPVKGFWSITPEAFGLHAEPHTISVDVRRQVPRKLAAINEHRSQVGSGHPFSHLTAADAEHWLGMEYFRRAAIEGRDGNPLEHLCAPTS